MKALDKFCSRVDIEIEKDPCVRLKKSAEYIVALELPEHSLTDDQRERYAGPALEELFTSAKPAIERGDFAALDQHLIACRATLRRRVQYEREHGELRPVTPDNQLSDHREALSAKLYRAMELEAVKALLKPGERIIRIDWHTIETDQQVIRRSELPKVCRPVTFRDGNSWRSQFVHDAKVEEAIEAERGRNNPSPRGSGPSAWIE